MLFQPIIATLPYVTLSCPILSCHVRYFPGSRKNNGTGTGIWLPVILPYILRNFYNVGLDQNIYGALGKVS